MDGLSDAAVQCGACGGVTAFFDDLVVSGHQVWCLVNMREGLQNHVLRERSSVIFRQEPHSQLLHQDAEWIPIQVKLLQDRIHNDVVKAQP